MTRVWVRGSLILPRLRFPALVPVRREQGKPISSGINEQPGAWGVLRDSAILEGLSAPAKGVFRGKGPPPRQPKLEAVDAKMSVPGLPTLEKLRAVEGAGLKSFETLWKLSSPFIFHEAMLCRALASQWHWLSASRPRSALRRVQDAAPHHSAGSAICVHVCSRAQHGAGVLRGGLRRRLLGASDQLTGSQEPSPPCHLNARVALSIAFSLSSRNLRLTCR